MFNRGGFPGQRPMGHPRMNQPSMSHPGMNMSGMSMSGMNISGMGMSTMGQQSMNHPGMSHTGMNSGMNNPRMSHPGMNHPNLGLPGMNQPTIGLNRMSHPSMTSMNQGGMGFRPEIKTQGFGMRPLDSPGSFMGASSEPMGMKSMPIRSPMHSSGERLMGSPALPQRFPGPNIPARQGPPRMQLQSQEIPSIVNRVLTHSSDHLMGKPKTPLQEPAHLMKDKPWNALSVFGNMRQDIGMKSIQSSALEQMSNSQNRYTNESASSILESFGLSNEDLEELSRYPDDQLTTMNMPAILRDIRLRKITRPGSTPDQGGGRRPGSEIVPSKVIDYGHSSKYQFNDRPAPSRSYNSARTEQKPAITPKKPAASNTKKPEKLLENAMDNKIPTISGSRKPMWQPSKLDRSNNKTLVGEQNKVPTVDGSVNISTIKQPVVSIHPEALARSDVPAAVRTDLKPEVPMVTGVGKVGYPPPAESTPAGKGNWTPSTSQEDAQKVKRLPTPSMMNDYYAASPRIFPHICSLCNVECRHLKDWIKHQNNVSHIENCRKLSQQYPDWNPQVLSAVRNEGKKDETTPKRSRSKSGSPRRSRRSDSRHRTLKSRSRSPRAVRTRSRSPRRPRNSPRRSRSPRRSTRSPPRSLSPRRRRRDRSSRTSSTSPDKRAVDAAVQNFIEASKIKSVDKAKPSSNGKKVPPKSLSSSVKSKKPTSSTTPAKKSGSSVKALSSTSTVSSSSKKTSSSSVKKPGSSSTARKPPYSSATRKTTPSMSVYRRSSCTPVRKIPSSFSSGKRPLPSKPSAAVRKTPNPTLKSAAKPPAKEAFNPFNKFTSKNNSGKIIHVTNLPDSGYTDQDILKIIQPFGKVCDILIVRSKNEAFLETNFKEAASAAVKYGETVPVMINNQRVNLCLGGQKKAPVKREVKTSVSIPETPAKPAAKPVPPTDKTVEKAAPKKTKAEPVKESSQQKQPEAPKHNIEVPPGFVKRHKLTDPPLKDSEKCIIVVSNLPETQYTVDEISNLAKPFGGVSNILLISTHRKAYLELANRNSVDSMIKFYNVFPTYLSGNLLTIAMSQRYKDLKDEDRIFADIIEQTPYKITPSIYEKFVYLLNLPEKEVAESEIVSASLQFGKVEHFIIMPNMRKAILHMESASAAKAMHSALSQNPCSIGESVVQCSLPSKTKLAENEYITFLEDDKASSEPEAKEDKQEAPPAPVKVRQEEKANPPLSESKDREDSVNSLPTSPISQTEMVDLSEDEGVVAPKTVLQQPDPEPLIEDVPEPLIEDVPEPLIEDVPEPLIEDVPEPLIEDVPEPLIEDVPEPLIEDVPEPLIEDVPEPLIEDVPEPLIEDVPEPVEVPVQLPSIPPEPAPSCEPSSSNLAVLASEDDDDEEEAAEAPEAPDSSPIYFQPEPVTQCEELNPVSQPLSLEELEVLVSVESDEEECEEHCPAFSNPVTPKTYIHHQLVVASGKTKEPDAVDMEVSVNLGTSLKPAVKETSAEVIVTTKPVKKPIPEPKPQSVLCAKPQDVGNKKSDIGKSAGKVPRSSTVSPNKQAAVVSTASARHGGKVESTPTKTQESNLKGPSEEKAKPKHIEEKPKQPLQTKDNDEPVGGAVEASKGPEQAAAAASVSLTRTAKFNPQKGDISVTLSVDNQKATGKAGDPRKRSSGERGSSGRESSTPKSNSNRSSPSDSASSNPKQSSGSSQKKPGGRHVSSQQERDSKDMSRSREKEKDTRSNIRKDDRSKGSSSSSRYARSSKSSARGPRSKEEDESFPFNLDEFVTVDEIIEEHRDTKSTAGGQVKSSVPDISTTRKVKRKENEPVVSDAKKSKGTSAESQELSFVTLDEVGDEEDTAAAVRKTAPAQPLVTDEVHAEDGPPSGAKDSQMLMTLDEISDEDDAQDSAAGRRSSVILAKGRLLTLDEVSGEEEEQMSPSEPSNAETRLLKDTEIKAEDGSGGDPNTKDAPEVRPAETGQGARTEQPLLTVDDDEEFLADMEHQFLTVDEVGEEEEDQEMNVEQTEKSKTATKSAPTANKGSSKSSETSKTPAPTPRRGRPRKRPLSVEDPAQQTSPESNKITEPEKTPTKPKGKVSKGSSQGTPGKGEDSTSSTPEKPDSGDGKSKGPETPAKKKKVESPVAEKPKLGPFNPSVPIGMEFLISKTGYFCELCSLFYMDEPSKLKHCKSMRHYQAVEKHVAKEQGSPEGKAPST